MNHRAVIAWSCVVAAYFLLDILTSLNYLIALFYVLAVTAMVTLPMSLSPAFAASLCIAATWLAYVWSPSGDEPSALFNRGIVTSALVIAGIGLTRYRKALAHREASLPARDEAAALSRAMVESLPQLVWTCNADGVCDYLSPQWMTYTGAVPSDDGWRSHLHPEDAERVAAEWQEAVRAGRPFETRLRIRNRHGVHRWFHTKAVPARAGDGRVSRWCGSSRDIDEVVHAEDRLRGKQETLARIIHGAGIGLWDWELATHEVVYSPAWKHQLGYETGDIQDTVEAWCSRVHPDDLPRALEAIADCVERRRTDDYTLEHRVQNRDGSWRWILSKGTLVCDETGQPIRVSGFHLDVRQRKETEEELQDLALAQSFAMPGIAKLDPDGRYLEVNDYYAEILGCSPEDLIGRPWQPTVHPDDRSLAYQAYKDMQAMGKGECRLRGLRVDGSLFYKHVILAKSIRADRAASGNFCFMRDITEMKRIEEVSRQQDIQARVLEEREAMGRNLHDGVLQSLYAVRLGLEQTDRLLHARPQDAPAYLHRQIQEIGHVITEVRRFVEGQDPLWSVAGDLRRGLEQVVAHARRASAVEWRLDLPDQDLSLWCAAADVTHVLYIVREAMSNTARHADARRGSIEVTTAEEGFRIEVADDGRGFTHKPLRGRSKHGVDNMAQRAERIGGALRIESSPGAGTRVVTTVPRKALHVAS